MSYLTRIPLLVIALTCPVTFAGAASETATPAEQASNQYSSQSPEFKAAEDGAQRYMAAYNQGDAKTLANFFAEDCDYIDKDGAEVKGRDAIQKLLAENFQANPGIKLDMTVDALRQLNPDVRVNRGSAVVTPKDGAAVATRYVAINVKKGDQWLISQLTETGAPPPNAYSQLQALEWLVGTWEDKTGDQTVETKINWVGDKNFLARTFKVKGADQTETDGWEIIGWDPARQQIRSWIFDSNGGFGESTWANDGEHWLIQASNVLPDGSHSTAEHVLTRVDDNKFTWESQNRTLNGDPQPSLDKIEVQRLSQK
ncbi:MAG TPA: SgcJ/EcaC family oxidoreductase [Bryobacteraceae bacterium]|nr:SgcJ/EcaC family oxidoreductase [Bryobacteraceae bacterium]